MTGIAATLLSLLLLYKYWVLLVAVFFASFILPIPTNTLLLAAGAFSSEGYFNFFISLAVVQLASMLGDCFGYYLAWRYGQKAIHMLHIHVPSYLSNVERYVREHPGPTIFVTRFFGTVDSLVNVLSGFTGVSFGSFLFYDFLGNIVSNGAVIYAGYFFGIYWQNILGVFDIIGWVLLGLLCLFIVFMIFRQRNKKHHIH